MIRSREADLIVVARVKENSLVRVTFGPKGNEDFRWEYHAVLIVTEVLKGDFHDKELPIAIVDGLSPGSGTNGKGEKVIPLFDSFDEPAMICDDISKDQIWFLSKRAQDAAQNAAQNAAPDPKPAGNGIAYETAGWSCIKPTDLKPYYAALFTDHPDDLLKPYLTSDDKLLAATVRDYFDHKEIAEIAKDPDPASRFDRVMPYYLRTLGASYSTAGRDAALVIMSCGDVAGEKLIPVFENMENSNFKATVISMWEDLAYTKAVPVLIKVLETQNHTNLQQQDRNLIYSTDRALGHLEDPSAKKVLEETKNIWATAKYPDQSIVGECTTALKAIED
ncbi:MAG TPA: hypothetical protein VG733_12005 [Chthoniobacteraceae bacterium]|nr:hypothetical protein [Chthoniobacteraceae bacterium]